MDGLLGERTVWTKRRRQGQ
uniref:Uncharacterized protein n=1 Tax=Anguilla anguilla TaxID=7936 RepID=A0A0E9RH43_ANGAN